MQVFKSEPIQFIEIGYYNLLDESNFKYLKHFLKTFINGVPPAAVKAVAFSGFTEAEIETAEESETNICFIEDYGFVLIITSPSVNASNVVRSVHLRVNEKNVVFKLDEEVEINNQREKETKNPRFAKLLQLPVLFSKSLEPTSGKVFGSCITVGARLNAATIQSILDTIPPTWEFQPDMLFLKKRENYEMHKLMINGKHRFGSLTHVLCSVLMFKLGSDTYILQLDE